MMCVSMAPAFSSVFNSTFGNFETAITIIIKMEITVNNQYNEIHGRFGGTRE
jgi:hypothetical protein